MMKKINNWLDKPLTWREVIKDTIKINFYAMTGVGIVIGGLAAYGFHLEKKNKPFENDFEVERTEVKEDEE